MGFGRLSGNRAGRYGTQKVTKFGTETVSKTNRIKVGRKLRRR